jgi:hypothetical protein
VANASSVPPDLFDDWQPGDLLSFPRANPGTALPEVCSGGRRWLLEDLHCIDPRCPCTDVRFVVFDLDRTETGSGSSLAGTFVVSLPSLAPTDLEVENGLLPDAAAAGAIWQQLTSAVPDLADQLAERRQRMKLLTPPAPVREAPAQRQVQPGRNDPCPCGSGNKWKKCCGR